MARNRRTALKLENESPLVAQKHRTLQRYEGASHVATVVSSSSAVGKSVTTVPLPYTSPFLNRRLFLCSLSYSPPERSVARPRAATRSTAC